MWAAASESTALLGKWIIAAHVSYCVTSVFSGISSSLRSSFFSSVSPSSVLLSACPPFTLWNKYRLQSCVDNRASSTPKTVCVSYPVTYIQPCLWAKHVVSLRHDDGHYSQNISCNSYCSKGIGGSCWKLAVLVVTTTRKENSNPLVDELTGFVNHSEQECV